MAFSASRSQNKGTPWDRAAFVPRSVPPLHIGSTTGAHIREMVDRLPPDPMSPFRIIEFPTEKSLFLRESNNLTLIYANQKLSLSSSLEAGFPSTV